jgi:hypothetical protein
MDEKAAILMKLFMCFPSTTGLNEETSAMMVASYLETLSTFSPSVLAEACDTFKRRATRFAPSVGEIYDRCAEVNHKAIQVRKQLPPPDKPERSEEERARMQKKFQDLLAELKRNNVVDEYVPSGKQNPVTGRREAAQWLERHGAGSNHEVKNVVRTSPELEAYLARAFPQNFEAAE